jgi:hypothetical protein
MDRRRFIETLGLGLMASTVVALQTADAQKKPPKGGKGERHPKIRAAIRALQGAKTDLEQAATDFGGHRAEALEAVNNAIKQLQTALQADKK